MTKMAELIEAILIAPLCVYTFTSLLSWKSQGTRESQSFISLKFARHWPDT